MPKFLKYLLLGVLGLLLLAAAGIAILAATFDPNDYKPLAIKLVQEKKQRTLAIPGQIKLTFFPKIGADLGEVSLSDYQSANTFVSAERARVSLALLPLLSRQLVVDQLKVEGLTANIRRNKDGSTNFDDLLSKEETQPGQQIRFDVDSISIARARIGFDDQMEKRKIELTEVDLETGRIANGVPSKLALSAAVKADKPAVDARVALKTGFTLDLDKKQTVLKGLDAELKGALAGFSDLVLKVSGNADTRMQEKRFVLDGIKLSAVGKRGPQTMDVRLDLPSLAVTDDKVAGGKLSGQARLTEGPRTVNASFAAPSFEGSPQAFKLPALTVDATVKDGKLDAKASIAGSFSGDIDKLLFNSPQVKLALSGSQEGTAIDGGLTTPLTINLKTQVIDFPAIVAGFSLPNPGGGSLKLNASGRAGIDLGKENVNAVLKGKLDESNFDARLGMSRFSPAAYTFDIELDRLDADRYRAKPAGAIAKAQATPDAPRAAAAKPIDLSFLRGLQAAGKLKVGSLNFENIKTTNLRADIKSSDGKLDISPLTAELYSGNMTGSVSATASNPPAFAVRQNLAAVNVGALLKDAIGKDRVEGRGNVQLDVTAAGATFADIKQRLNGSARVELRDGAIRGVNIAQAVRSAKAKIGALRGSEPPQAGAGTEGEKTDFSELTGSFRITNGVAHNEDLLVKSPLARIGGSGDIDLARERLDYLARATIVSTLQGQGGPELQALKGLTVPVRLSGPFSAITWKVDFQGLVGDMAKQKVEEKKEEVRTKAQEAIDREKSKAQDQIKEGLKGLFGR
jgi:AsmA protein